MFQVGHSLQISLVNDRSLIDHWPWKSNPKPQACPPKELALNARSFRLQGMSLGIRKLSVMKKITGSLFAFLDLIQLYKNFLRFDLTL